MLTKTINKNKILIKKISLSKGIKLTLVINLPVLKKEIEDNNKPEIKQGRGLGGLQALAKMRVQGGPKDLSSRIDEFLYQQ